MLIFRGLCAIPSYIFMSLQECLIPFEKREGLVWDWGKSWETKGGGFLGGLSPPCLAWGFLEIDLMDVPLLKGSMLTYFYRGGPLYHSRNFTDLGSKPIVSLCLSIGDDGTRARLAGSSALNPWEGIIRCFQPVMQ